MIAIIATVCVLVCKKLCFKRKVTYCRGKYIVVVVVVVVVVEVSALLLLLFLFICWVYSSYNYQHIYYFPPVVSYCLLISLCC